MHVTMKSLHGCLLWASVGVLSLHYVRPAGWRCPAEGTRPTSNSAFMPNTAHLAVINRLWPGTASPPRPPSPRLRLRAATTVELPTTAEVATKSVAEKLLQEILPQVLTVAYSCSQTAKGGFQATAHVELREISDAETRALQGKLASGIAAAAHVPWGQLAYTQSLLPIGLFFHHVGTREEASFRVRLPGVRSQPFSGAVSTSRDEAEQSAASVIFYTLCNSIPRSLLRDMPRSLQVPAGDFKTKLSQLLVGAASQQLESFAVDCQISPVPIGGFTALAQVRTEEDVRSDPNRIESFQSRLRTEVCASRADAGAAAMDTVYEAVLKPLWKTTVKLGRSRPVALPSIESSERDFERHLRWRGERLEALPAETGLSSDAASSSLDLWFGGVCLCCLAIVSRSSWQNHAAGERHRRSFNAVPVQLSRHAKRPSTEATVNMRHADQFVGIAGWADRPGPVLSLGEMDYSFSCSVAKLLPTRARLLATSYLEEHDPLELEYHPKSDAERTVFSRRSLPAMDGALQKNLRELKDLGVEVKHGVDATNLQSTLRVRFREPFKYVVFPFPRATLRRENDPRNSELVHGFFRSALPGGGLVAPHGVLQLLLLEGQYEEWDVAGAASDVGLVLTGRVAMPENFYQPRDTSGQRWKVRERAELLCFKRLDVVEQIRMVGEGVPNGAMNQSFVPDRNNGRHRGQRKGRRSDDRDSSGGGRNVGRRQGLPQSDRGRRDSTRQSSQYPQDVPWA